MAFFNKKEEVIDIQLTRYGKKKLASGNFKPKYYQFFDDDIVYSQASPAYTSESQNETQDRILNNTPRHKSNVNRFLRPMFENPKFSINPSEEENKKFYNLEEQERILLYPLSSYESNSQPAPFFSLKSYNCDFNDSHKKFLHFTGSGIYKKVPQLEMEPRYTVTRVIGLEMTNEALERASNANRFIDLTSDSVEFLDKSRVDIKGDKIVLTLEEANADYNLSNFELEIYEMDETSIDHDVKFLKGASLKRIKNIDDINFLFHIKTDEDVEEIKSKFGRENNWYRMEE